MDSISQAALGAAIGEAVLGGKGGRKGALLGAAVATIPDLDVIGYLFFDSLQMLSIHRGFSHSIVFSILGGVLIACLLKRIKWTKSIHFGRLWLFAWLALFTHILLDAFTAYGTQLYLPFSDQRVGFDSVNVVDPVYTLPLLIGLLFSLFFYKKRPSRPLFNYLGLGISTLYLLGTLVVKNQVNEHFHSELRAREIAYTSLLTMPVGMANVNWYGIVKTDAGIYMRKYSILEKEAVSYEYFPINDHLLEGVDPELVAKMKWFAKGYYVVSKEEEKIRFYNLQVDMRGIIKTENFKAPTLGYFEITPRPDGSYGFSSGSHLKESL